MKIHTGGVISMGLGVNQCRSSMQNFNTKRSSESELVGASDYVPYDIWYIVLMHHHWYFNKRNNFLQEHQRAMNMEVNGRNYWTVKLHYWDQFLNY